MVMFRDERYIEYVKIEEKGAEIKGLLLELGVETRIAKSRESPYSESRGLNLIYGGYC
jgi:hypothetical protein